MKWAIRSIPCYDKDSFDYENFSVFVNFDRKQTIDLHNFHFNFATLVAPSLMLPTFPLPTQNTDLKYFYFAGIIDQ